jgi:hypothetical protein
MRRLLIPLPPCFGKIAGPGSDSSDAEEEQGCLQEYAELRDGLNFSDDEDILHIHYTRFCLINGALLRHIGMIPVQKVSMYSIIIGKSILSDCDMIFGP